MALAGLAACTSMTLRMYADAMVAAGRWQPGCLGVIEVEASEKTPQGGHLPDGVHVTVRLRSGSKQYPLSEDQRARLLRAAERCPVKRMMGGAMAGGITTSVMLAD
ncbi:unnamed protein product [Phaeothamnion confervicola]